MGPDVVVTGTLRVETSEMTAWRGEVRTVPGMFNLGLCNAELESELARYAKVPAIVAGIKRALGVRESESLGVEHVQVRGYLLIATDEIFRAFLLGDQRLSLFEMNAQGATLSVSLPLSRITRVAETRTDEVVVVVLEMDADVERSSAILDWREAPQRVEDAPDVDRGGRMVGNWESRRAIYELAEVTGSEAEEALSEFALRLRASLS